MIRFWKSTNANTITTRALTVFSVFTALTVFTVVILGANWGANTAYAAPKVDADNGIAVSPVGFPPAQKAVFRSYGDAPYLSDLSKPQLAPANPGDTCSVDMGGEPWWLISGWILGNELFSNYQDPDQLCPGAYPFSIQSAHMFLNIVPDSGVALPFNLPLSVTIHDVDTTGGCKKPGAPLFVCSLFAFLSLSAYALLPLFSFFLFFFIVFFFNDTATTEIYTLSLHDALPI